MAPSRTHAAAPSEIIASAIVEQSTSKQRDLVISLKGNPAPEVVYLLEKWKAGEIFLYQDSEGNKRPVYLTGKFSPELVDAYIYVIDVAEGDKIPRKGGPAIRTSDLLLINKTELAPYVGADLEVMARDAAIQRGSRPFLFADLKSEKGKEDLIHWLKHEYLFI